MIDRNIWRQTGEQSGGDACVHSCRYVQGKPSPYAEGGNNRGENRKTASEVTYNSLDEARFNDASHSHRKQA